MCLGRAARADSHDDKEELCQFCMRRVDQGKNPVTDSVLVLRVVSHFHFVTTPPPPRPVSRSSMQFQRPRTAWHDPRSASLALPQGDHYNRPKYGTKLSHILSPKPLMGSRIFLSSPGLHDAEAAGLATAPRGRNRGSIVSRNLGFDNL